MENTANAIGPERVPIDQVLENAVVLSWDDLLHELEPGLVRIEYAPGTTLDYLKIWQLVAKGAWNLICEYWMIPQPAGAQRLTFNNGVHSNGLSQMLEVIMQHQADFTLSEGPGAGMIQVTRPGEEMKEAAAACMKQAYSRLALKFESTPSLVAA